MALQIKAKNVNRVRTRLFAVIISIVLIIVVASLTAVASAETRKTITVVRLKADTPIAANTLITENMVEAYDMYYKEFQQYGTMKFSDGSTRSTIVRWEDRDYVLGKRYAAYYMRENTVLFWDSTIADQTRKNSYLYSMSGELLNINMNTVQDFGDMVVPGDSLNIRASYVDIDYSLPSEEQYQLSLEAGVNSAIGTGVEVTHNELMFSEVQILDMLNSAGNSIFDIYYDYIAMTKEQQAMALQDDGFLSSVKPASILLEVTSEEVERYMYLEDHGARYQMTLLPRKSSSSITDSLSEIQKALSGIAGLNN